ncbi:uncharacterized protein LOC115562352 isoform X2 [Drosophila navojoa]|uniref:uncharacterized protein LOC115562352 isoform X2 n=1 Tax=Drosophila navojoa TaxID=7232 RepID=UPI0011BE9672|nr:uncharacterized protein LOC115562352 isoform X2 [Drosophila navojoa]
MSERSKGDVSSSSRVNNNASRIVKNPLLSASVTGLSYDDFPNKPLLLPAAPPVVHHAPPAQPANALIAGILKREPKTLVTVGQPSGIDESEALDEINLNASSSDDSATTTNASNNPYQSGADANANPLLEPPLAADSLLSQAASSFGALPSVASNVFSTFSKRIYAGTREADEAQPQLDIQPTYIQQAGQVHAAAAAPAPFYAAPPAHAGEAAPEPPKFYAPTEVPSLAAGALPPPPSSAGQNTYRISARKKLYAPIPGLSEQHQQPVPAADPFQAPPYPTQPAAAGAAAYEQPAPLPVQEERKSGGLFSLTNLVPSGVLQNISGLVQSATGRSNEPAAPPPQAAYNPAESAGYFEINTSSAVAPQPFANYFTPAAPSAAADYFAPSAAPPTVGGFFNPSAVAATPANFFTPATAASGPATLVQSTAAFAPQAFTHPGAVSQQPAVSQSQTVAPVPPSAAAAAPPPPAAVGAPPQAGPTTSLFTPQTSTGLYQPHEASAPAASLFAPASSDKAQEVPLYSSSTEAKQELPTDTSNNFFTPQTQSSEQSSSSNQRQEVTLFAPPSTAAVSEVPLFSTSQSLPTFSQGSTATLFTPQLDVKPEPQQTNQQKESEQETSLVTAPAPPTVAADQPTASQVDEPTQETPKTPPTALFQELSAVPVFFPPIRTATTEAGEETPLYVPVPAAAGTAEAGQSVELYPPAATTAAEPDSKNQEAIPETSAPQPIFNANSLFASPSTGGSTQEALGVAAPQPTTAAPPLSTSDLFAPPAQAPQGSVSHLPSVALTTQTTTTFFNPFAQSVTTPLPQDPLTPPIGFVEPSTQTDGNSLFAAQTIEPEAETAKPATVAAAAPPPPPPQTAASQDNASQANPFRKAAEPAPTSTAASSALLSFFTPAANGSDFNFFGTAQQAGQFPELPPLHNVAPPALAQEPPAGDAATPHSTQALGFEQLISDSQQAAQQTQNSNENIYQNSSVNTFSGYFGSPVESSGPAAQPQPQPQQQQEQQPLTGCNSANFFDHFAAGGQGQEDQRIQNFFNNPPLQDQPAAPGELKYDIVHSGLPNKRFEQRSQTSVSNIVEPPSSACSEFSTAAPGSAANPTNNQQQADRQSDYLLQSHLGELPEELLQQLRMANDKNSSSVPTGEALQVYTPVLPHWFYKRNVDGKFVWTPFSHYDSALLETSLNSEETDSSAIVPVEGGRYDVNIKERTKTPVYWEGKAIEVRRCSWFYKGVDGKYVPYEEQTAEALEMEYRHATETNEWHKKIPLANGEQVTMHGPNVIVHFMPPSPADSWGGSVQGTSRPLVVKRDLNDFKIQQGESQRVDHLLFMVHGIGSACDLKMRNVEEVVDDFRYIAQQLVQSHYKNSTDMGLVGRVEVLPIEWHGHLHSEELGIDEKLRSITLESIPRLRNFTNDTLLDVLFYTSPKYCQKIMNTVADALNETYLKYRMRHPEFNGGVSLAGHSLGSLILFDLLCHQEPLKESEEENKLNIQQENPDQLPQKKGTESKNVQLPNNDAMMPKQVSYAMGIGPAGTGQPVINYTQLIFHPKKFFALGSPIGMFVTIRGIDKLGLDFRLPTCAGFYNIFHPFDPVAYRIEALVNPDMKGIRPVLIPHHKGRKRMHLELKETMTRVGADIKQRFMDTFKTTLDSVNFLATVTRVKKEAEETLEKEVNSSNSQIFNKQTEDTDELSAATTSTHARNRTDSESTTTSDPEFIELDFPLGKLNDSKRVDYVLQEAPLEFINEYIFALSSHVCYWGSEDTILFVMKEIYAGLGISTDSQVPQQTMTIERPSSRTSSVGPSLLPM